MAVSGTLKSFMEGKGFGFIKRDDGEEDVFMHFSKLTNGGSEDMQIGMKVRFDLEEDERSGKLRAQNVTITEPGTGQVSGMGFDSRGSGSTPSECGISGILKSFTDGKGFGFVERDDGKEDVFMHFSQLKSGSSGDMVVGMKVRFDVEPDPRSGKHRAANVEIVGSADNKGGSWDDNKGKSWNDNEGKSWDDNKGKSWDDNKGKSWDDNKGQSWDDNKGKSWDDNKGKSWDDKGGDDKWKSNSWNDKGNGWEDKEKSWDDKGKREEDTSSDWICPDCQATVFASKRNCFKCNAAKPADPQLAKGKGGGKDSGKGKSSGKSSGKRMEDWKCPNCGGDCFGSKSNCFKCNTENPAIEEARGPRFESSLNDDQWKEHAAKKMAENQDVDKQSWTVDEWIKLGRKEEQIEKEAKEGQEDKEWEEFFKKWTDAEWLERIDKFITDNNVDGDNVIEDFKNESKRVQHELMEKGELKFARNPSAVLITRLKDWRRAKGILRGKAPPSQASHGKGKGKTDNGQGQAPEKLAGENWEEPRSQTGLKLLSEALPQASKWEIVLNDDSRRSFACWLPSPFDQDTKTAWFEAIKDGTTWLQPEGSNGPIPRKTAWMTAPGCACEYKYGGIEVPPTEYPPWMVEIMSRVMPECGIMDRAGWPTCCNMNIYEDGGMSVGWHSDNEALFQGNFVDIAIISLSLGVTRRFELRKNWPGENESSGVTRVQLASGDLMTMEGMLQKHFQHRVPKEEYVEGPRINLTWRWVLKHRPSCPAQRNRGKDGGKGKGGKDFGKGNDWSKQSWS